MYVIVLKSKLTGETFGVARTVSNEPRRFTEYGIAERTAYEINIERPQIRKDFEWVVIQESSFEL